MMRGNVYFDVDSCCDFHASVMLVIIMLVYFHCRWRSYTPRLDFRAFTCLLGCQESRHAFGRQADGHFQEGGECMVVGISRNGVEQGGMALRSS